MDVKSASFKEALLKRAVQGAQARAKRAQRRRERTPARALELEWRTSMNGAYGFVPEKWTGAENVLAKRLVEEHGFDKALEIARHFVGTWEARKWQEEILPGFKLLWAVRTDLIAELDGRKKTPTNKKERLAAGEYSEAGAQNCPDVGW